MQKRLPSCSTPLMLLGQQWSETGEVNPLPEATQEMLIGNVMAALPVIYALNRSAQPGERNLPHENPQLASGRRNRISDT